MSSVDRCISFHKLFSHFRRCVCQKRYISFWHAYSTIWCHLNCYQGQWPYDLDFDFYAKIAFIDFIAALVIVFHQRMYLFSIGIIMTIPRSYRKEMESWACFNFTVLVKISWGMSMQIFFLQNSIKEYL